MKDSCPNCYTNKFREIRKSIPVKMETPDGMKQFTQVMRLKCRRCGWEGQKDELVSLSKFSVTKLGKIRSRMKRRK